MLLLILLFTDRTDEHGSTYAADGTPVNWDNYSTPEYQEHKKEIYGTVCVPKSGSMKFKHCGAGYRTTRIYVDENNYKEIYLLGISSDVCKEGSIDVQEGRCYYIYTLNEKYFFVSVYSLSLTLTLDGWLNDEPPPLSSMYRCKYMGCDKGYYGEECKEYTNPTNCNSIGEVDDGFNGTGKCACRAGNVTYCGDTVRRPESDYENGTIITVYKDSSFTLKSDEFVMDSMSIPEMADYHYQSIKISSYIYCPHDSLYEIRVEGNMGIRVEFGDNSAQNPYSDKK